MVGDSKRKKNKDKMMNDLNVCGVYKITRFDGKMYVGSSINIKNRWKSYINVKCEGQPKIYNSLKYRGVKNHKFEIVLVCNPQDRLMYEHIIGMHYDVLGKNGLNCALPAYDDVPQVISEEAKQKRRSDTIYHFYHTNGTHDFLTQYDFKAKYDMWKRNANKLCRRAVEQAKGWRILWED